MNRSSQFNLASLILSTIALSFGVGWFIHGVILAICCAGCAFWSLALVEAVIAERYGRRDPECSRAIPATAFYLVEGLLNVWFRLNPKRRWAQFSLGTMFVIVTALCAMLALWVGPAERQRRAVAYFKVIGGQVEYAEPPQMRDELFPRNFLRRWLPRDYFEEVRLVGLDHTAVTDAGLAHLESLKRLQVISLCDTQITDAGLIHLHGLTTLTSLNLGHTQIADGGLARLQRLTSLQRLCLDETSITDAGLAHLHKLTDLQELSLGGTQITDAGLMHLHELTSLQRLFLHTTQVTGAGFTHLDSLASLEFIYLNEASVTDAGLTSLRGLSGLRALSIAGTQVTDASVPQLHELIALRYLDLSSTGITDDGLSNMHGLIGLKEILVYDTEVHISNVGLDHLQHALPDCMIYGHGR